MAFFVSQDEPFLILTYNVISLRNIIKKHNLVQTITEINPDIIFFQEIKLSETQNIESLFVELGYKFNFWNLGDFGISAHCKYKPLSFEFPKGMEGRTIILYYTDFTIINVYAQNAGEGLKNLNAKLEWNKKLNSLLETGDLLLCGDLNVANDDIDIWVTGNNLKKENKVPGFSPIERQQFKYMLKRYNLKDIFREEFPNKREYTYYGYRHMHNAEFFSNKSDKGWRIDYFLIRGGKGEYKVRHLKIPGSDHLPVLMGSYCNFPFTQVLDTVKYTDTFDTRIYRQSKKNPEDKPLYRMFEYADYYRHRIYIAFQNAEKSYQFMSFRDSEHFENYYSQQKLKCHYEIIRQDSMCKLYFDIDSNKPINNILNTFDFKDLKIKKSLKGYHIICNKLYKNNEVMKPDIKIECDMKVYTKNRLMRILYSTKYGKNDPFYPVNLSGIKLDNIKASDYFIS